MGSVRVISIKAEYEPLLSFLFPTYSYSDSHGSSKFIAHHDIISRVERDSLNLYYDDCIFISTRIFDEVWDEERLKDECVKFANNILKSRKKRVNAEPETFVQDCLNFIYNLGSDEDSEIGELLEAFGSQRFTEVFLRKVEIIPVAKLIAALNTFISKILLVNDASSVYYKSKAMLYKKKIRANMVNAIDNLRLSDHSDLAYAKFYLDLFSNGS